MWTENKITELTSLYKEVLNNIDDNPNREGLIRTPERVAKSLGFLTNGYKLDPDSIVQQAIFHEEYYAREFVDAIKSKLYNVVITIVKESHKNEKVIYKQ